MVECCSLLVLSLLLASCVSVQPPPTHEAILPSGKKIKVIAEGPIRFGDGTTGLMLKYQTDLKVSDIPALQKEAEGIWRFFRRDVERMKLKTGVISANERPIGLTAKGYNFVYQQRDNGVWQWLGDKPDAIPQAR